MAASEAQLGELHEVLASYLTIKVKGALEDAVQADKPVTAEEAEAYVPRPIRVITAAEMACAIALCKNSNITAAKNKGSALDELRNVLKGNTKPTPSDLDAAMEQLEFNQRH